MKPSLQLRSGMLCRYLLQTSLILPVVMLLILICIPVRVLTWRQAMFVRHPEVRIGRNRQAVTRWIINPGLPSGITRLLTLLRADVLPAALQILGGNCDLVGPRLCSQQEADELSLPLHRYEVLPGIVSSYALKTRMNIAFQTEAETEQEYLSKRSLRHDTGILLRFLLSGIFGSNAAGHKVQEHIAGIPFINLSQDELVSAIMLALRLQCRTRIAFINPDCVNIACSHHDYKDCLQHADWVCPDGIGMRIAGHLLGREVRQNLNGTDLLPALCKAIESTPYTVYLLGAKPGVAEKMADCLHTRFPGLKIAGVQHGYFRESDTAHIISKIRDSRASILLVGFGAPKQELWIQQHLEETGACIGIGVGGLFDFYSGNIPRAPLWMREIGMEWAFRLIQEPQRMWRRYLIGNIVFLHRVITEKVHASKRSLK